MDISRCLAYLISSWASMGFIRRLIQLEIQVEPRQLLRKRTHKKTRLACLYSKINDVVEAQIVKRRKGKTALRCSPLDKGLCD